ncbi:hypothetical protein [Chitinophaga pinensis]|uniref:hypothetical protein n=1 Tax=Chitinophaga pinensis TaxID=79329 RepID=UPI00019E2E41|nr:hypothetical protein [Chitinophaga pinensis]
MQKTWIRTSIEHLSAPQEEPNTYYGRYTFTKEKLLMGSSAAWNGSIYYWSFNDPVLTIGNSSYIVEELTDTSLVFYEVNRSPYRFVSETVYSERQRPDTTAGFNGHTLYVANRYLTPRYKKEQSLYNMIFGKLYAVYPVKHAATFLAKFVVTDRGEIERINIVNGIAEEHSNEFIRQIQKTSGDWNPAKIGNMPVYSEVTFEIVYQDALNPKVGTLSGQVR